MEQNIFRQDHHNELHTDENVRAEQAITNGDLPEAARILVGIIEQDPQNWRAYNNLGIISWSRQAWKDAYAMFAKSVSTRADYADALVNLFDAALKLKRIDEICPLLNRALEINPTLKEIQTIRDVIQEEGDGIYQSQRAMAIGTYSSILEEAARELDAGNLNKAMEKFLEANDTEGPSPVSFCGLGIISYYQKRYADAFSLFYESIKLNPLDSDTFLNLLDAAKESGRLEIARDIFNHYRNEYPELDVLCPEFNAAAPGPGQEQ